MPKSAPGNTKHFVTHESFKMKQNQTEKQLRHKYANITLFGEAINKWQAA